MLSNSEVEMLSTFDCDVDWNSLDTYLNIDDISPIARASSSCPDLVYGDDLISQSLSATYWKDSRLLFDQSEEEEEEVEEVYPKSPVDIIITVCDQPEDLYTPKFNLSKVTLQESFPYKDIYCNPAQVKPIKCTKGMLHVPDLDKYGKLSGRASRNSCRKCRSSMKHPKIHIVASSIPAFFPSRPVSITTKPTIHLPKIPDVVECDLVECDLTLSTVATDTWETCSI